VSVETITDAGYGGPLHVIFRVSATSYDQACDAAKREAKASGWATKTRGGARQSDVPGEWLVELAARPPSLPDVLP
jgi:hypothetical protein